MSKKNSKWLYHFSVPHTVEEEIEIDPITNEEGEEIKQFKKVKKEVPLKCGLLKPTRKLYEDGELFYSVELSKYIQAGMLTKTLLAKRFANDGGALSDKDQEHYSQLYSSLHTKEQEVQRIQLDTASAKKRAEKLQKLILEITSIRQQLVEFESTQAALFDQTAEHKARNRAILWWVLQLSFIRPNKDSELEPFFAGESFEEKINSYDVIEEKEDDGEEKHLKLAMKKFAYFVSFWYSGQAADKEGFKAAEELLEEVDVFAIQQDDENAADSIYKKATEAQIEAEYEWVEEQVKQSEGDTPAVEIDEKEIQEVANTETNTEEAPAEEAPAEEAPAEEAPAEEVKDA